MNKRQMMKAACAILTTLAETPDGWAPSGHLYMALQTVDANVYTLSAYYELLGAMGDWIEQEGQEVVRITSAGRAIAARINDAVRAAS